MNKNDILGTFNNHILDFFNDVSSIYPEETDMKVAYASLVNLKKVNPKLIISIWKEYMLDKYKDEIVAGNVDFFINRNYKNDLITTTNTDNILETIDALREPMRKMGPENLKKTINYVKNLTKTL